ncbi:glutathione S-transferase 2-like [Galleria mellonella]|uniref:glutathione transferase n=1 Tax=Galleria mellonella TaxID=7137 RepID=A0ABM3MUR8_GALME|nr:glutathione S-transferase 2-like [Galleria mellonella]XP_052755106.1 glutathione S-transferase 2-like [Galleria mellonella]XP_052755107.1 glutathione S-transferase 2-like [Galleria mellonella]
MPKAVFHYFPVKALGEPIRLLLSYGGQEFEDDRVPFDKWPEFKSKTPFGQMPVLELNGKVYAQSVAISRYLGRKYGLAGADIEEDFLIDQYVDFVNDIRTHAAAAFYEPDAALKAKKHEENVKNVYPVLLGKLEEIIRRNNGHLVSGKLTWGDFVAAGMFDHFKMMMQAPDLDTKYPNFKRLQETVLSLPRVKEYVAAAQ